MADERSRPPYSHPSLVPVEYAWPALLARDGDALFDHYRHTRADVKDDAHEDYLLEKTPRGTKSRAGPLLTSRRPRGFASAAK